MPKPLAEPALRPSRVTLRGRYATLVPLTTEYAEALFHAAHVPEARDLYQYLAEGPFASVEEFRAALEKKQVSEDPLFFAILDAETADPVGMCSYLRIEMRYKTIEVGHLVFTPKMQRTRIATDAMYLMAKHAFEDLGFRRYEWKCNLRNEASKRAATRLGFMFEGVFRQHMIVKGESRDTAWFAMLDQEWPAIKQRLEQWLDPANFDAQGRQIRRLEDFSQ